MQFTQIGQNTAQTGFIYQWQTAASSTRCLPAGAPGSRLIVTTKPQWGTGRLT